MDERGQADWPPQWKLSAPESHVIELRGGANGDVPLILAVKELVADGVLSAQEVKRNWLFDATPRVYAITDGPRLDAGVSPLLEPAGRRGMWSRPDFDWTDEGRQADRVLQEWLELGRANLGRWASIDPVSGAKFLSGAGAALLLLDGYAPELTRLGQRLALSADRLDGPPGNDVDLQKVSAVALAVAGLGGLDIRKIHFGVGGGVG